MAEFDAYLDSMLQRKNLPQVSYIDDEYADALVLKESPSKGHGVFAKRSLPANEPVYALNYPTMMAIDAEYLPTTCYHCLVVTTPPIHIASWGHTSMGLKTCGGCQVARFCGKDCQVKAWYAYHKLECKILKKMRSNLPPVVFRAVMRVVLLKDRDMVPEQEWNCVISSTAQQHILGAQGRSNLTDMAVGIQHLTEAKMGVDLIEKLIFIMKLNQSEVPTLYGGIGVMLDPFIAKLNHSCEPNIAIHRPQYTMAGGWLNEEKRKPFLQIIPLRKIEEGEELLNCYIVPTVSVKARRAKLYEDYLFECNCLRCQHDIEAVATFAEKQPDVMAQFDEWAKTTKRQLSRASPADPHALRRAAVSMNKAEKYLEYPTLYTTGDFPEIAMGLISKALNPKSPALDEALLNALRLYFLVNPARFGSGSNPTNVYTIFLLLDIFDALVNNPGDEFTDKCVQNLQARGLSRDGLIYWRARIQNDFERRLKASAAADLLVLLEKRNGTQEASKEPNADAEKEMRTVLGIREPIWTTLLKQVDS